MHPQPLNNNQKQIKDREREIEERDRYFFKEEQKRLKFIRKDFEDALRKINRRIKPEGIYSDTK